MTKKIALVVDDKTVWRDIFANALMECGYTVETASTYATARKLLLLDKTELAVFDVALDKTDSDNRDGLKLCSLVHTKKLKTKVILVTGTASPEEINLEAYGDTLKWFLEKTAFEKQHFIERIAEIELEAKSTFASPRSGKLEFKKQKHRGFALVIEDSNYWQTNLKEAFEAEGFEVTLSKDAPSALGNIKRKSFDIVSVDLELASSEDPDGNRDGRSLIPEVHKRGIPTLVVSAKLNIKEVVEDYQNFKNIQIIDKAAFSIKDFRETIRELTSFVTASKPKDINTDLVYKVVLTFLRNSGKLDKDFYKKKEIIEICSVLEKQVPDMVQTTRDKIDQILDEKLNEAAQEEINALKLEGIVFQAPEDILKALMQSLLQLDTSLDRKIWPLRTSRIKDFLVLDVQYRQRLPRERTSSMLQSHLAVENGALNRMRVSGIKEIASTLRIDWI